MQQYIDMYDILLYTVYTDCYLALCRNCLGSIIKTNIASYYLKWLGTTLKKYPNHSAYSLAKRKWSLT